MISDTLNGYMSEDVLHPLDVVREIELLDPTFSLNKIYHRLSSVRKIVDSADVSWKEIFYALGKIRYMDISSCKDEIYIESENRDVSDGVFSVSRELNGIVLHTGKETEDVYALFILMADPHANIDGYLRVRIYTCRE
jgi:hypothetical protein